MDGKENWRRRLAGETVPIFDGQPEEGFYRRRFKRGNAYGPWLPASIYRLKDHRGWACEINGDDRDPITEWPFLAPNPISEEEYEHHVRHGRWPDEAENPRAVIGDNQPPEESDDPELDALIAQFEQHQVRATEILPYCQPDAPVRFIDAAQNLVDNFKAGEREVQNLLRQRLEPVEFMDRSIRAYFQPLKEAHQKAREALEAGIALWHRADLKRRQAGAEEAAKLSGTAPQPVEHRLIGGATTGRRSRPRRPVTKARIVDIDACFQHFKDFSDIRKALQKAADQAIKNGPVPGCEEIKE